MKISRKLKMKDLEEIKKEVHLIKEQDRIEQIIIDNIINNNSL